MHTPQVATDDQHIISLSEGRLCRMSMERNEQKLLLLYAAQQAQPVDVIPVRDAGESETFKTFRLTRNESPLI